MKGKRAFKAVIFDLDGVITQTALVHSKAWKEMFDQYLHEREQKYKEAFKEFTHYGDYLTYVDGKPRYEGVKSFLESRGIRIEYGHPDDGIDKETYCGIGNRKNLVFNAILERDGVDVYPSTLALIHQLKDEGIKIGVASSSRNCERVLRAAGILSLIETRVDGEVSAALGLKGKPAPDIFVKAANNLGVTCHETVVVEDAISGVQAARKGNFGLVIGLAREDNAHELKVKGADIVASDIEEIGFAGICQWFDKGIEADGWSLSYHDYNPNNERSREALLSVGNGYFGTRGAMEEMGINAVNYPATYLAGGYNRLRSYVSGREVENEDLVNVTNWLTISFSIDGGAWWDPESMKISAIKRSLNLKDGILEKEMITEDTKGKRTQVLSRRFASMSMQHLAAISYSITPINYSGDISIRSRLSANHINEGVKRYAELNQNHLESLEQWADNNYQQLKAKTSQSGLIVYQTARLEVKHNGKKISPLFLPYCEPGISELVYHQELKQGEVLTTEKIVFIQGSHLPLLLVEKPMDFLGHCGGFEDLHQDSALKWAEIWDKMDIRIKGDRLSQKLLRLHIYHLMSTFSPHNIHIDFSIPARGLTGEAYRGHIFWDELFILPLYFLHFREIARSALMYRYRRLEEARRNAQESGYRGAMFPWQSGSSGREETQKFHYNPISGKWDDDFSSLQRHVNLAIAYNIIQYDHMCQDHEFMLNYGAEMLIGICQFWASKAEYNRQESRYSVSKVMGPDEFHEHAPGCDDGGLKDNAYTNVMMAWMFKQVVGILGRLKVEEAKSLMGRTNLEWSELHHWNHIAENLRLIINTEGVLAQFDGYFDLKEIESGKYLSKYGNIHRMDRILKAEGLSPDNYQIAKQADTLMMFYTLNAKTVHGIIRDLGYNVADDYLERNIDYYLPRTSHGSTLSRVVHAYLAQLISRSELAWSMFHDALGSDYEDIQGGTTAEGIHTGVMAGTVMIALTSFAGINLQDEFLEITPQLPPHWQSISFGLAFRNIRLSFTISHEEVSVCSDKETKIRWNGHLHPLEEKKWVHFPYHQRN